jgi:hypothetical protein
LIDGRNPLVVEHFFARSHEPLRFSVTLQAPLHLERLFFPHERHLVHLAMTRVTTDTFLHVDAVVEVNEISKVVKAVPLDRLTRAVAFTNRLQHGTVLPNLGMTGHTSFRGRDSRKCAVLDRRVTVAAVQAETADVMLVAERNGLLSGFVGSSDIGGTPNLEDAPDETSP